MAKFRNRTLIFVCLRTKIPPAVLAVMCGVSLGYFGDCHVTGTWLVLLRQFPSGVFQLTVCTCSVNVMSVYRSVLIVHGSGSSEGYLCSMQVDKETGEGLL